MAAIILEYFNSIVTFASLAFVIKISAEKPNKSGLVWFMFGFIYTFYCSSLLYTTYPIGWINSKTFQTLGVTILITLFSIVSALLYSTVALIFKNKIKPWTRLILFSISLAIVDIIRSILFSILFYGPGGSIGLNFDVASLGHSLSTTPFIEYSYFGGTYILTFILAAFIFSIILYKELKYFYCVPIFLSIFLIFIHLIPINNFSRPVKIAVITTDFTETEKLSDSKKEREARFLKLEEMTYSLSLYKPDIIVYPEDSRFIRYLDEEKLQALRKEFPKTLLIDGDTRLIEGGFSNLSLFYETKGDSMDKNDRDISARGKIFLFPFSEYMPSLFKPIFIHFMAENEYINYKSNHTYKNLSTVGSYKFNSDSIVTLICSELFSYSAVKKLSISHPPIIFFQSNLVIFHNKPFFNMHLRSFTKIAASTVRSYIISSSNGSDSYIISPYGKIIYEIPRGFLITKIEIDGEKFKIVK